MPLKRSEYNPSIGVKSATLSESSLKKISSFNKNNLSKLSLPVYIDSTMLSKSKRPHHGHTCSTMSTPQMQGNGQIISLHIGKVYFINLTCIVVLIEVKWWAVPWNHFFEVATYPPFLLHHQSIATLEPEQYQEVIDCTKYLKVGKNFGFHNLFLYRNEDLCFTW